MSQTRKDIISAACDRIMVQAEIDQKFRADFEKYIGEVYDSGAKASAVIVAPVPPLSAEEINLVRESLRGTVANPHATEIKETVPTVSSVVG